MKTIKLGELCDINPKDALPDKGTLVSFIPMQRVSETGQVDATETRQSEEVTKGFSSFREGDILMAKITPCMENGKGGIAKGLCNGIGYGSTEFHVIRPTSPLVRTEWIYYYTTYPRFRKLCEQNMTGSAGQKRVPKSYLLGCPIPVPNLNTQDKVIHSLRSLRSIIELRRAQLMKLDELVKCRFVEMFGNPQAPEIKWELSTFGNEFEIFSGGTPSTGVSEYWVNGTIPWIGSNMCQDVILSSTGGKYITEEGFNNSSAKWAHAGYVIVALVGATIGKTALLSVSTTTNQNVASINVPSNINYTPEYIYMLMRFLYPKFMDLGNGGFKMANLGFIRQLPLPTPPIGLQREYSAFMLRIDKLRFFVGRV